MKKKKSQLIGMRNTDPETYIFTQKEFLKTTPQNQKS